MNHQELNNLISLAIENSPGIQDNNEDWTFVSSEFPSSVTQQLAAAIAKIPKRKMSRYRETFHRGQFPEARMFRPINRSQAKSQSSEKLVSAVQQIKTMIAELKLDFAKNRQNAGFYLSQRIEALLNNSKSILDTASAQQKDLGVQLETRFNISLFYWWQPRPNLVALHHTLQNKQQHLDVVERLIQKRLQEFPEFSSKEKIKKVDVLLLFRKLRHHLLSALTTNEAAQTSFWTQTGCHKMVRLAILLSLLNISTTFQSVSVVNVERVDPYVKFANKLKELIKEMRAIAASGFSPRFELSMKSFITEFNFGEILSRSQADDYYESTANIEYNLAREKSVEDFISALESLVFSSPFLCLLMCGIVSVTTESTQNTYCLSTDLIECTVSKKAFRAFPAEWLSMGSDSEKDDSSSQDDAINDNTDEKKDLYPEKLPSPEELVKRFWTNQL